MKALRFSVLFPFFLILYEFCTNMSNDMYLPALSLISADLQIPIHSVQWTITAWFAGTMAVQLLVGPLSDRYGRRPILFGGGVLFLLATLSCSMAPALSWLIAARFLQGIGVCTMMVAGYASVHDLYEDREAIHVLAWMGTVAVLAPAIGPAIGGLFLLFSGWRMIFLSLFILALIALACLWFFMPESAALDEKRSLNPKTIALSYLRILVNPAFIISAMSFGLAYGGVIGWITVSPVVLMSDLQLSATQFGWLQIPVFGGYIIGAQLVKNLIGKMGKKPLIAIGLMVAAIGGIVLIIFSLLIPKSPSSFVIPMMLYTLGFGFAAAPLNRLTLTATEESKGSAMAMFYSAMAIAGTCISIILILFGKTPASACLIIASAIILSFALHRIGLKVS